MNKFETGDQLFDRLQKNIRHIVPQELVPDFELRLKADKIAEINRILAETNTVALLHNYMEPILFYAVNGKRGDSLELSRQAAETPAQRILFCGVVFMAETAKILSPDKRVIVPSLEAGCTLADGIKPEDVDWFREKFPGLPVVTYINSTAAVKAKTDVCCTSGNVMKVVQWAKDHYGTKSIIFLPDKYMAGNIARDANMELFYPTKDMDDPASLVDYKNKPTVIGWNSRCYVHEQYRPYHVQQIVSAFPDAVIWAHPEVPPDTLAEVIKNGGKSGSTAEMIKAIRALKPGQRLATMTECSMADNVLTERPDLMDSLIRMCNQQCKYMKTATVEDVHDSLTNDRYEITVEEEERALAEKSVRQMFTIK